VPPARRHAIGTIKIGDTLEVIPVAAWSNFWREPPDPELDGQVALHHAIFGQQYDALVWQTAVTDKSLQDILRSNAKWYVEGMIYYSDIFSVAHKTKFCFFFSPDGKADGSAITMEAIPCDYWNCADQQNCDDEVRAYSADVTRTFVEHKMKVPVELLRGDPERLFLTLPPP
jgi:hypothetical protein